MTGLSKYQYSLAMDLAYGNDGDEPNSLGRRLIEAMLKKGFLKESTSTFGYQLTEEGYGAITDYANKKTKTRVVR